MSNKNTYCTRGHAGLEVRCFRVNVGDLAHHIFHEAARGKEQYFECIIPLLESISFEPDVSQPRRLRLIISLCSLARASGLGLALGFPALGLSYLIGDMAYLLLSLFDDVGMKEFGRLCEYE